MSLRTKRSESVATPNKSKRAKASKISHHTKPSSMSLRTKRSESVATPNKSKQQAVKQIKQTGKQQTDCFVPRNDVNKHYLACHCERNAVRVWQPQTRVSKQRQINFHTTPSHLACHCERNAVKVRQTQTRVSKLRWLKFRTKPSSMSLRTKRSERAANPNKSKQQAVKQIKQTGKQQTDCFVPRNDRNKQQVDKVLRHTI